MADNVLTGFGILLSIVGIVLFVRTKVSGDNSMQMLGLSVKVSHPSLLIFFAGILLVLIPRLLPSGQQPPAAEQGDPTADEGAEAGPQAEPQAEPEAEPEETVEVEGEPGVAEPEPAPADEPEATP